MRRESPYFGLRAQHCPHAVCRQPGIGTCYLLRCLVAFVPAFAVRPLDAGTGPQSLLQQDSEHQVHASCRKLFATCASRARLFHKLDQASSQVPEKLH
eukprot:2089281-Amphidinium_carterae.1